MRGVKPGVCRRQTRTHIQVSLSLSLALGGVGGGESSSQVVTLQPSASRTLWVRSGPLTPSYRQVDPTRSALVYKPR